MKKRRIVLTAVTLAVAVGLMLTACGSLKEAGEKLPASQEYVSADGAYKVIMPEGLTQTDMSVQAGAAIMELAGGSDRSGFSCIFIGSSKANIMGNPSSMESLEDYADHMAGLFFNGSGVTVKWEDMETLPAEGFERCLARKGVARSGMSKTQLYGYYAESANNYLSMHIMGDGDDVEAARQVIAFEILNEAAGQGGTKDFINGMTAVLDSVNGASVRETFKMLRDMGADKSQLEVLVSGARQGLSESWGVETSADLVEMADSLINEGHNQKALALLKKFGGTDAADRSAFEAKLKEQNLDKETCICLLAAYDAWSAYGDGAIAAWDLSRVGTIMGFGYAAGYCTYEEAMDKTLEAAKKAQELYGSWKDFNMSYLYGYSYWAEESLSDPASSAAERAALVKSMEAQAGSPFAKDWNIELKREW